MSAAINGPTARTVPAVCSIIPSISYFGIMSSADFHSEAVLVLPFTPGIWYCITIQKMGQVRLLKITREWIRAVAPNAAAFNKAREFVKSLSGCTASPDHSLLSGVCKGSGEDKYAVSADFIRPEAPAYYCACPSRQKPCKHALALMLAFAEDPESFTASPVSPKDASRRAKSRAPYASPNQGRASGGRNKSADAKRAAAQAHGLQNALLMAETLAREGFGAQNGKTLNALRAQNRALGDSYLPGVQTAFARILSLLSETDNRDISRKAAFRELAVFYALCRRSLEYFNARRHKSAPLDTQIETWCGRVWHTKELADLGLIQRDARLVQLAFESRDNPASREFEDTGWWAVLGAAEEISLFSEPRPALVATRTLRPFRAAGRMREEDSCESIVNAPFLARYPDGIRVRWDEFSLSAPVRADFDTLLSLAKPLSHYIKQFRDGRADPLVSRELPVLAGFSAVETDNDGRFWLRGEGDAALLLDGETAALLPSSLFPEHKAMFLLLSAPDGRNVRGEALSLAGLDGVTRLKG